MSNSRKSYSSNTNLALLLQVKGKCPLCGKPLLYKKNGGRGKEYEIAHIYPLNPDSKEKILLENEDQLSEDVNSEDNVIPLCKSCHTKFDNPRTVEEYQALFDIKRKLLDGDVDKDIMMEYKIQEEIQNVISALYEVYDIDSGVDIDFIPKAIDEKLDSSMPSLTKMKIRNNVRDYFLFIKRVFIDMDKVKMDLSELISAQIKSYYLSQKTQGYDQQKIFENIVEWINLKTNPKTSEASEIIASFFIQNCEVF